MRLTAQTKQLTGHVRVYTDGDEELTSELTKKLVPIGNIVIERRRLNKLVKEPNGSSISVILEDGTSILESFLVHKPMMQVNGPFVKQLGLETFKFGHDIIKVDPPFYETSVKGCFAVGDCASAQKVFVNALSMGSFACAGLTAQLQMEA